MMPVPVAEKIEASPKTKVDCDSNCCFCVSKKTHSHRQQTDQKTKTVIVKQFHPIK